MGSSTGSSDTKIVFFLYLRALNEPFRWVANVPVIVILPECSIVVIITKWYFTTRGTEWKLVNTIAILFYSGATRTPLQIALTTELVTTPQFGMNTKLKLVFESSTEMFVASSKRRNWRSEKSQWFMEVKIIMIIVIIILIIIEIKIIIIVIIVMMIRI